MIRLLSSKDKINFLSYTEKYNSDFYVFENGKRNFLVDNRYATKIFNSCIKRGNKALIYEVDGEILGIAILLVEEGDRVLKILGNTTRITEKLLQVLFWNNNKDFYVRIKRNNFLYYICEKPKYKFNDRKNFGFKFVKNIGKESIFKYKNKRSL